MNNSQIALGVFVVTVTIALMGYVQSIYSDCQQFGEQISKEYSEPPVELTFRCIGFNLIEVLLIGGSFVGVVVGFIGFLN